MSARSRSNNFGLWSAIVLLQCAVLPHASANIFLNGEYQQSASHVTSHVARNPFLDHAIISRQAAPFTGPTYLPPKETLKCASGQQCVRQESCKGGYYFAAGSALPKNQACSPDTDVCCTYRQPVTAPPATERPSVPCGQDYDCVQSSDCRNGEISALNYMKLNNANRCYAPEVCCRLPSTTLTQDGYLVKVPQTSFPLPTNPTVTAATQTYRPQPTQPIAYRPQSPQPTNDYLPPQTTQSRQAQPQSPQPTQARPTSPQPTQPRQTYSPQPQPQYTPQSTQSRPQYTQPQTTKPRPQYTPQPTQERPQYSPQPTQQRPQYSPQPTPQRPQYIAQQPNNGYLPPQTTPSRQTPAQPQPTQPVYSPQPQPQTTQPAYRPKPQPQSTQSAYRPQPQPQATQPAYRPQPQPQTTQTVYRPQPQPQQPQRPQTQPRPTSEYLPPVPSTQVTQSRPQPTQPRPQPTQPRPQPTQPRPQPTQPRQPTQPAYRPQPQQPQRGQPNKGYLPPITDNRIPEDIDRVPESSNVKPQRGEDQLSPAIFPQRPQPGVQTKHFGKCASALVCTPENYCNTIGVITDQPVNLTPMEAAFRVPLTDCLIPESGAEGKCCRDSNYVDPWPVNLAGVCAARNKNTKPAGIKDIDANFAEIPWQAMVLKDSSKTLLCGGAIIGDQFVLTTASCVSGQPPSDVKVKAGEWELGGTNEPLPFQLVTAQSIDLHPEFNPSTGANDMAIIRLAKRFEFASHIQPICISDEDPSPSEQCITTGWGKQALQIHEEGAIMHVTKTSTGSRSDCGADETGVCSATQFDACEFDVGSALACGSGSSVRLKGVYTTENSCGEGQTVRFTKPDVKWINTAFADRNRPLLKRRV